MAEATAVEVTMPEMGESVTEGTVLEWHVAVGDTIEEGETLVEVSTDKVDAEVPAPVTGTIAELRAEVDDEIEIGSVLAVINPDAGGSGPSVTSATGEGDADLRDSPDPKASGSPNGSVAASGEEATPADPIEVTMPEMGESVTEGTVLEWHVAAGDKVDEGQTLIEVSTDKVDAEVPAPSAGEITKLLVEPDEVVSIGAALVEMVPGPGSGPVDGSVGAAPQDVPEVTDTGDGRATPLARRIAAAKGLKVGQVSGTGPGGKVTKGDVLAAGDGSGAASASREEKALRGPAGMLAKAMDESRSIPTATSFRTIAVDTLDAKRKGLNGKLAERGMKVSFTHLVAWAIVLAAREWPVMGRHFEEKDGKSFSVSDGSINLGIAVDVEKKDGSRSLMVPAIKGADRLDFPAFHAYYEDLITKTRENRLTPDDFVGTNITLTNPGGIGTVASVPRLMTGQGTIVAAGSIAYPPEWSHADQEKIEQLGVSKVMTLTSTYDHRIIQGAESGNFLKTLDGLLAGGSDFYESVADDLGIDRTVLTAAQPKSKLAPPLVSTAASPPSAIAEAPSPELLQAVQAATSLLKAYRTHGHLAAHLDPLGGKPKGDPALDPETVHLTSELMAQIPASILRIGVPGETLLEALPRMKAAYTGSIGYQFEHISSHGQRVWLREMVETGAHRKPLDADEQKRLLNRLIDVFEFERFLEKAYLGQKMFSIEGLDSIVTMLDELTTLAAKGGAGEVVLGMAHRGRLSVLAHTVRRPAEAIFAEFEGGKRIEDVKAVAAIPHGGTGDVKYHYGHEGVAELDDGSRITVHLYPNPSHLEFVDPVITGATRYSQGEVDGGTISFDAARAVPVVLHGDAAFPGQGVVAETFNLQSLEGYSVGGTIHIIENNQIGFTTNPTDGRSTPYAADMAKGFNVPILHVNADDVEACSHAMRLAMSYRERWGRDIVIDVIGYRRFGHNETDEPAYTQPLMTSKIKAHKPVSELYTEQLIEQKVVTAEEVGEVAGKRRAYLKETLDALREKMDSGVYEDPTVTNIGTGELDRSASPPVETAVSPERLRELNQALLEVPASFTVHRKLRKPLDRRIEALEEGGVEFAHAEALALASLITEGKHIRMTGQDTERGTFSQRHLVLHDEKTGLKYAPIQHLADAKAPFELHNSPLSEIACLGFEYGYASSNPDSLVLWEAQFGDFANSAQVIIDSFISSGESKWGLTSRLTLLLPHGHEGAGPEHSSARMERFLSLAAEGSMRVANPSNAAQYFHLLRRQAMIKKARPLVVFTPKGLLRQSVATASLKQLTEEHFHFILDDPRAVERREKVERLVLCSGRIYYDIDAAAPREAAGNVAVARVELLYPFPKQQIAGLFETYPNLKEVVWTQEEPANMGAWSVMRRRLPDLLPDGVTLGYVGRPERSSPSEGYSVAHIREQERIVLTALTP
ncbi:MAG TPA: multifunctional oxoglutarate decarboxylase/oxoglutarate dehydrogenase thiamine pyrophosphate-binding subunit/dihydrolipoyllysine-residue succinyltransferase subunit [Solirubrobacterales bacterium]|nr:multifunctional oxoglutarate decarboxylase/oxoglutarate dehydrogenase thiamine pyrophosphate-binding subunit/dihydrolipoyllysine-residue succinyltransferase subunit [Solirubrobacterales bacterium]